ncbi:MAG: hypothetical protein JSV03_09630 [Planctomycetota bacterium]|nr:MAG: hypothetical protein JSV03_09630 [Planctomycetota bacterium]
MSLIWFGLTGCDATSKKHPFGTEPLDDAPMETVIARINQNSAGMNFLMRAIGDARGEYVKPDGSRNSFHLRNILLYRKPRNLYLQLEHSMSGVVMEIGSNDTEFWVWSKQGDQQYWWGLHSKTSEADEINIPVRPDHLLAVLGLGDLPKDTTGDNGPVFRVRSDHYELMFMDRTEKGQLYITKTLCIERREPFLIREIIFSNLSGRQIMNATLSKYKTIEGSNVLVPHQIEILSLKSKNHLKLDFDKMERFDNPAAEEQLISQSPRQRGERLGHVERIDEPSQLSLPPTLSPTTPSDNQVKP